MLACISFNFLHHGSLEPERAAWPSYGKKNEIDNIISAPKNDKLSNYLCQLEHLCGCKFLLHLRQKHVKYDFSKLDDSRNQYITWK